MNLDAHCASVLLEPIDSQGILLEPRL
jgi:hypothetical protein